MKLLTLFVLVGMVAVTENAYSQRTIFNLELNDVTVREVFQEIEDNSEFILLYNEKWLDVNRKVIVKADNELIESIMDQIFEGTQNTYNIYGRQIVVLSPDIEESPDIKELPDIVKPELEILQKKELKGTIIDNKGFPIPGVSVIVKGTTTGTVTDADGQFSLSVPMDAKTLVFSFVGKESKEIAIDSSDLYNVVLYESVSGLDEVVVIGYGTQKKISVTGAISSVEGALLSKSANASMTNSLAGHITGVTSVQYTGRPGDDIANIYIRGIGSLTESASTPLVLVDGVDRAFSQLDPNEVESISVLKDASATAIYGIRGANGVIIVTTKRGLEGAPKISFTSIAGFQEPTRLVKMVNSYEYATKYNEAQLGDDPNGQVKFSQEAINAFKTDSDPLIYPSTDWLDYLLKPTALQTQQNINISGGSKIVKYFVSLGALNQGGLIDTHGSADTYNYNYKRYNYRANIDLDMTKSTIFHLSIGGRSEIRLQPNSTGEPEATFFDIYRSVPFSGLIYEGNQIRIGDKYISESLKRDGARTTGWGRGSIRKFPNFMNIDIGLTQGMDFITKGLSWRIKVSQDNSSVLTKTRRTIKATYDPYYKCDVDPAAPGDSTIVFQKNGVDGLVGYDESSSKGRKWYMETALSYDREFGPHHITGLLLYNQSKSFYPQLYPDIPVGYVGLASRVTYNYNYKYMVDINLGYNGSENFAEGKRFGLFPAVSVGWIMSSENFMKTKMSFLDYLKLRFSYGVVGNDILGNYRFLYMADSYSADNGDGYSFGTDIDLLQRIAEEERIGNPDVTWEKAKKLNIGIDFRTIGGKLGVTADYFHENRNNILSIRNNVPGILALSLPALNIGQVENKGFEVEFKWWDSFGKFNYYLITSVSYARNKILYMDEVPKNEEYLLQTGRSVNARFGYVFDDFFSEEDITHLEDFADQMYMPKAGDVRYQDLNNDGVINTDDQRIIGFPDYPEYNFSLSGGADFKGFDFSMLWNGVTSVSRMMNDTWRVAYGETNDRGLLQWLYDNSWTPETAATATAPRISFSGRVNNTMPSSLWLRNASYLRLKNIQIGYSFGPAKFKRLGISSMRVFASGYNLLTFDEVKYFDPESRTSAPEYPLVKIVNLGVNVNF